MMRRIFLAAALALVALPASGQQAPVCAPLDRVAEILARDHGEKPVALGDAAGGQVILFASPSGSWTIVVASPDGRACLVSDGVRWRAVGRGV